MCAFSKRIIIGVDPGTVVTGYGVVEVSRGQLDRVASGTVRLPGGGLQTKLSELYARVLQLLDEYAPGEVALESVFHHRNVQSALKLGHARAAIMLAAIHRGVPIYEYSPKEMKLGVVGSGGATKEQVAFMVRQILRIDGKMRADESDALGLAICHAHRMKRPAVAPRSWEQYVKTHPERIKS